jgi:hypothetical protein
LHKLEKASSHPHLKRKEVKHVFRKGAEEDANTYHAVNFAQALSKILEKVKQIS